MAAAAAAGDVRSGRSGGVGGYVGDERDSFIAWLRGEFAAANAIIDLLLAQLSVAGEPGEYDGVFASVHQRRFHWTQLIHMQQFFPITDVHLALDQVWRRYQQPVQMMPLPTPATPPPPSPQRRNRHRISQQQHHHQRSNGTHDADKYPKGEISKFENEEKKEVFSKIDDGSNSELLINSQDAAVSNGGSKETPAYKEYVSNELIDGKMVNVAEGLKLYENLADPAEIQSLVSWVNAMRSPACKGELQGKTFLGPRRPMRGHGREVFQFGIPVVEGLADDENNSSCSERSVEPIPSSVQDIFSRLLQQEILSTSPDYCVVDVFNEGDHSHPYTLPSWYGRPVCILCLTGCDMIFGRSIASNSWGDHRGQLKVSIPEGALLVMRGNIVDAAKRAIPSIPKRRILLTFGKFQPKKMMPSYEGPRYSSSWAQSSAVRPSYLGRHSPALKPYAHISGNGVIPAPLMCAQNIPPPSDRMQPLFVPPPPVAPAAAVYTSVPNSQVGWKVEAPLRSSAARFPVPGTGVFLPPGSCNAPPPPPPPPHSLADKPNSASETVPPFIKLEADNKGNTPSQGIQGEHPAPKSNGITNGSIGAAVTSSDSEAIL